jgi:hypothetical protein
VEGELRAGSTGQVNPEQAQAEPEGYLPGQREEGVHHPASRNCRLPWGKETNSPRPGDLS